jgi:hypothetical protein
MLNISCTRLYMPIHYKICPPARIRILLKNAHGPPTGLSLQFAVLCVSCKSNIIRIVDGSNQSGPLRLIFSSLIPFVNVQILIPCGWIVQLLLFVIYETVLQNLNGSPSISAYSNELAITSTIDILCNRYYCCFLNRFIPTMHQLPDRLITRACRAYL